MSESTENEKMNPGMSGIKHIIAVASGKGGVGKSTVTVNLAVALQKLGFRVGLMDADIYGPSQPGMLGSQGAQPEIKDGYLSPTNQYGIDFVSIGLLLEDDSPVVWRAPMAMKMINQFIAGVIWGELDYLLIDLPPGTGDVQLTLAQQASLSGAVIVTTPQQVALGVSQKGLKMFQQVNVPIVGIVENMSGFICKHCGEETAIFKEGGGSKLAEELSIPFLGALPLDPDIMDSGDNGIPVLTKSDDLPASKAFLAIAQQLCKSVKSMDGATMTDEPKTIDIGDGTVVSIDWPDGHKSTYSAYNLRVNCMCAVCVDENTGQPLLDRSSVALDITVTDISRVGRYGLAISLSDTHNTGIYTHARMRKQCECSECMSEHSDKQQSFSV